MKMMPVYTAQVHVSGLLPRAVLNKTAGSHSMELRMAHVDCFSVESIQYAPV